MSTRSSMHSGRRSMVVILACASVIHTRAQEWNLQRALDLGPVPMDAHLDLALENDLFVVGISSASGGSVRIHRRNEGGPDQWEPIAVLNDPDPWAAHSLVLRGDLLLVGSPSSDVAGAYSGKVRVFRIDTSQPNQPLSESQPVVLADAQAEDRFGYAMELAGDTLWVSAIGRSAFHVNGVVQAFSVLEAGLAPISALSPRWTDSQLPFTRGFGVAVLPRANRVLVAAPFSGFDTTLVDSDIGSLHAYVRDATEPNGWRVDTVLFDHTVQEDCGYARVQLGRWGLGYSQGCLVVDHSNSFSGVQGNSLVPWPVQPPSPEGCAACGLRLIPWEGTLDLEGGDFLPADPSWERATSGWFATDDALFVEWFDSSDQTWHTAQHQRDPVDGTWSVPYLIDELDVCDDLSGPLVVKGDVLLRTAWRRGDACGAPGAARVEVQLFQR